MLKKRTITTATAEAVQPLNLEPLLTVADVAKILRVSEVQVHHLIRQEHDPLPSFKINGRRRFQPSEVKAWIVQHRERS